MTGQLASANQFWDSNLPKIMDALSWREPSNMVVLDDILLAPFARQYGSNAIMSPHDCMSSMFRRHSSHATWGPMRLRLQLRAILSERYESHYYDKALLVHVISHRDRVLLERINPRARYHVVPNDDMLNPGFRLDQHANWDVMLWGSLDVTTIAQGVRQFLQTTEQNAPWWRDRRVLLVGKLPFKAAQSLLGMKFPDYVTYSERLEDNQGNLHAARITVVPDVQGAGMKNRCVNVAGTGRCLACLYSQMEGIDALCDIGAVNANSMPVLVQLVRQALETGEDRSIAARAAELFEEKYAHRIIQAEWIRMIQRAIILRKNHQIARGLSSA